VNDEQDVIAYLTGKGVQVYRAAGTEVTAHCWWCPDGDPKGKGKLYLNTESWLYECKRCGEQGNRRTLLAHYGDEDEVVHAAGADPMIRRRILTEAADLAHLMLLANKEKLAYLRNRGISEELIVSARLGYVPRNVGLSDMLPSRDTFTFRDLIGAGLVSVGGKEFFNDCLLIPYFSHGTVIQIREKAIDGKYRTTANDRVRLYNADALWGADVVLITEGEFDSLAVRSQIQSSGQRPLETMAVVGLPGAGSWPEGLIESLDGASKVFIGLDPDETGEKFAAKLKEEIGPKARLVHLPGGEPKTDWTSWFQPASATNPNGGHGWRDLRDLLVEADLAGKQMFNITDAAAKWQRRQIDSPGLQLGFESLDSVIRPGLKPGQIMMPLAKSGTGKTVFLSNIAHNLREKHVLTVSLEMTAAEVFEHMRRIHHFWFPSATRDDMLRDYARFQIVERNRIGRGDLGALIREYTEIVGHPPEVVIVDYLQYYARGFRGGSMYERVSDAAMELKAVAKEGNVGIICPSQVNRGAEHGKPLTADDARDSGVVDETADFVLSLFRPDQLVNRDDPTGVLPPQTGNFNVGLLKSRHGGKGRVFQLRISSMSLAIADAIFDKNACTRITQENNLFQQGLHYDKYRHQTEAQVAQGVLPFRKSS